MGELRAQESQVAARHLTIDVSVVIVNYNVREFLQQALRSVSLASSRLNVEVIVVDNDSADGSAEMVRRLFPNVHLIANDQNVGFSKANNQGIRVASGRHLLILNPDTILQEDTLEALVRFLDAHPEAGAVGCQILNPDGTFAPESRRAFPTPRTAFYRITGLSRLFPNSPRFGRYNMTFLPREEVAEVDALSGSCMLVRRDALIYHRDRWDGQSSNGGPVSITDDHGGAGLFDEDFFMYGEDLDWCYRIQQSGWKIFYTPETRIIHYKGESTKKGEMRYVRLFYGAMLKFAEKHLHTRYSWVMKTGIRGAIFGRAALSVMARAAKSLAHPAIEFALLFLIVSILGWLVIGRGDAPPPLLFFASVSTGFALISVISIGILGGYTEANTRRLRNVWKGVGAALLVMAAISFFIKDIAYSRLLLALSFVSGGTVISMARLAIRGPRTHQSRRVLLVGNRKSAVRFLDLLSPRPDPRFSLVGYVPADPEERANGIAIPYLGPVRQLRDIVRLRRIDEVVFSAECLSNQAIFHHMQQLQALPVQFRILTDGSDYVIGKSSIDDLSAVPLVDASRALRTPRSPAARRAFEVPVVLIALTLYPLVALISTIIGQESIFGQLHSRMKRFPDVLIGKRALVGFDEGIDYVPPDEWHIKPGVFAVTDSMSTACGESDLNHAYWFYLQHQSASMDWDIIWGSLRARSRDFSQDREL